MLQPSKSTVCIYVNNDRNAESHITNAKRKGPRPYILRHDPVDMLDAAFALALAGFGALALARVAGIQKSASCSSILRT